MNLVPTVILPLHMIAGIGWLGLSVIVAMNAGKGGAKAFRIEMLLAVIAFASGGYIWSVSYGALFEAVQQVLAFGVLCALAAAGVSGVMVGRARRRLKNGQIDEAGATALIGRAHQFAAGLLILTLICMGIARQI